MSRAKDCGTPHIQYVPTVITDNTNVGISTKGSFQCASTFHYLSADLISLDISGNFSITVNVIENKYCNQTN